MQTVIATDVFFNVKDDTVFSQKSGSVLKKYASDYANANMQEYTKTNNADTKIVKFYDDDRQTGVSLSKEAFDLLYSHFSKSDFIDLGDGSVGLSGEANAYVEGWFKDIAYARDFVKSDIDNDGKISQDELMNVKKFCKTRR